MKNKTVTIMRGVPGSGKSTKAATLGGLILAIDDFFTSKDGRYHWEAKKLAAGHAWNVSRCQDAMRNGNDNIIIDCVNGHAYDAKRYCQLAKEFDYNVVFVTADSSWAFNAEECFSRCAHGVPLESIKRMLSSFEPVLTVESCLASKAPWEK
jgi:predicted kinase